MYSILLHLLASFLCTLDKVHSTGFFEYRTKSNDVNLCSNLIEDHTTRTAVLRFLGSGNESNVPVVNPIKIGLTRLSSLYISGLEHTQLVGPIRFENVPNPAWEKPDLRVDVTLSFDQLLITGKFNLRGSIFSGKPIRIQINPVDLHLVLDLRRSLKQSGIHLPEPPMAFVRTVRITRWNGIRISGKGLMIKLFRVMHGKDNFDSLLKRQIEKTVRKQVEEKLR